MAALLLTTYVAGCDTALSAGSEMRCGFAIDDPFNGHFGTVLRSVDGLEHQDGRLVLTGKGIRLVFETTNRLY